MSMLSEQRRKTKWVVNPTKKPLWSIDSSGIKFGKELMEKMGWSAGKGLGLNEQGIQEPLRVSFKNDTKGMGFKGNDDNWIEHQDEFNSLLNQLRSGEDSSVVKIAEENKKEIKSLEEKSKTSKARVHYQKFTRGKDLSKYSESDLACIIGTNKMKKEKPKIEEIIKTEPKSNGNCETSFGVTTINSGSLQDYFKRKWIVNKNKSNESNRDNVENSTENNSQENNNEQSVEENKEKKSKKKKHKSKSDNQLPIEDQVSEFDVLENSKNVEERKRKRKKKENEIDSDNEPIKKKKRKNSDPNSTVEGEISPENNSILAEASSLTFEYQNLDSLSNKGKKEKNNFKSKISDDEVESNCVEKKKKRKKTEKSSEEIPTLDAGLNEETHAMNSDKCKLSKKKHKKEKILNNEIETAQSCISNEDEPSLTQNDLTESSLHEKSSKSKKIKKSKKENSEETESKITSTDLKKYSSPDETAEKFNIPFENDKSKSSKKKKKKGEKEKSIEEEFSCFNHESEKFLEVKVESIVEAESRKKEKKKKKKEKLEDNNCSNENEESLCEIISEESVKKKKKKRDKTEKPSHENAENQIVPEEKEIEPVKKKKVKLQKGNESQQSCPIEPVEKPEFEKFGTEKIPNGMDLSRTENSPGNGTKTEGEKRIENLKVNLFGDDASKKYFPQRGPNERVLKLIKWANISEFRGSNLKDIEGYGWKLMNQSQTR